MVALQLRRRLDRRLRPAAHRIGLEILLVDAPARAHIAPQAGDVIAFQGDCRRPGKAFARQTCRRRPRHGAPARTVLDHGRIVDAAHHLAARAVVLGNAQRLAGRCRVEPHDARADGRDPERHPGARRVIFGGRCVQRDAGADCHLVAENQMAERLGAAQPRPVAGKGQQPGNRAAAGMALGQRVAVMRVETIDRRRIGKRRAGSTGRPPSKRK